MATEQKVINLTAHTITEVTSGQVFPASGKIARVKASTIKVGEHLGCPIYVSKFGELEGLPEPEEGVLYIISSLALNAVPDHRTDVVSPGSLQRDEHGKPVGCVGFRRN